ncbi:glycosyltransferase, partial [Alphaproteobacteria bacterium]|nr:glycosyltransferase [Alphaproteobacteria bacterium]
MLISVVITTKNEEKNIENCLLSLQKQNLHHFKTEIIVVDNYSNDKTLSIAKKYKAKTFVLGPERNAQRNYGLLKISKGSLLLWIDADMILHPDLIFNSASLLLKQNDVVAVTFPEIVIGNSFFSKIRRFERSYYDNTPIDGSRLIKAEAFKKVGGFSNTWLHGPDDWDLDMELRQIGKITHLDEKSQDEKFEIFLKDKFNLNILYYPVGIYHNEAELGLINH